MGITFRKITRSNWAQVANLSVFDEQRQYVADNAYSIAEANYTDHSVARAIYSDDNAVGFLMYESLAPEGRPNVYHIFRFMVDHRHQSEGVGRQAMQLAIDTILGFKDVERITICYSPRNTVAKAFYADFGFQEVGLDEHGEMIAEITA